MKKTGIIVLIFSLLFCLPAEAQFGDLINRGKKAVKKAKEKVENIVKKANGDIDFYYLGEYKGFYRNKQHMIVLDLVSQKGNMPERMSSITSMKTATWCVLMAKSARNCLTEALSTAAMPPHTSHLQPTVTLSWMMKS